MIILGFIPEAFQLKSSALNCYQCLAFKCTNELTICQSAKEFIRRHLPNFYHINGEFPECPNPAASEEWERMKQTYPSSSPCPEGGDGEATCLLGRFRVVTLITESNVNVTAHGTVLGCAKRDTLARIRNTLIERPVQKGTLHTVRGCHMDEISSPVRNSLKHIFELEHCSQISDICHQQNYCVEPELSEVKAFQDDDYESYVPMSIFIWIGVALAVLVAVVTFLGFRYN